MEPIQPTTPEPVQPEAEPRHVSHTYNDDMSQAMNATEVSDVQAMLAQAREQEQEAAIEASERKERSWYSKTSLILIILTLGVLAYGTYYYMSLTVPVQPAVSVGIFSSTNPIVASSTTLTEVMTTLGTSTTLAVGKPVLVTLVTDTQTNTPITNAALYSFIGANLTEPLQASINSARLGVVNTGKDILPFIVASVPDPEKASNEFSIAEPSLLSMFSQLLSIDQSMVNEAEGTANDSQQSGLSDLVASSQTPSVEPVVSTPVVSTTFESQYFYNLPVRSLKGIDTTTGEEKIIFLYGYATNNVIVITSIPEVLKAVYDTLITQR